MIYYNTPPQTVTSPWTLLKWSHNNETPMFHIMKAFWKPTVPYATCILSGRFIKSSNGERKTNIAGDPYRGRLCSGMKRRQIVSETTSALCISIQRGARCFASHYWLVHYVNVKEMWKARRKLRFSTWFCLTFVLLAFVENGGTWAAVMVLKLKSNTEREPSFPITNAI